MLAAIELVRSKVDFTPVLAAVQQNKTQMDFAPVIDELHRVHANV